jgi:hypothetical protein
MDSRQPDAAGPAWMSAIRRMSAIRPRLRGWLSLLYPSWWNCGFDQGCHVLLYRFEFMWTNLSASGLTGGPRGEQRGRLRIA